MKYRFVARHRPLWPVRMMCRMLGVSHGGFYELLSRPPSARATENERLTGRIRSSFIESDRTYGSPRVWRDLHDWGEAVSENRVARLMQKAGLQARARRRRLPIDSGVRPEHAIAGNLLDREFTAPAPNQKWVSFKVTIHFVLLSLLPVGTDALQDHTLSRNASAPPTHCRPEVIGGP